MKFRKLVAPMVFGALSTMAVAVNAAGTDAGTTISNTATLNFEVNGASQTAINSTKDFKVDIKLDFSAARAAIPVATTETAPITLTGQTGEYYLVGAYDLTNATNTAAVLNLAAADATGVTVADGSSNGPTGDGNYVDNINLSNSGQYKMFAAVDTSGVVATGNAITELSFGEGDTKRVLVYALKDDVVGVDKDVLAATLTVTGKEVTVIGSASAVAVPEDDDATNTDAGVEFVFADADGNNSESATNALYLVFPDFGPGEGPGDANDPNKSGFVKLSKVLWDPINKADNPKAIPGATVQYSISITNLGSSAAKVVKISDPIPTNTLICTDSAKQCHAPKAEQRDDQAAELTYAAPTTAPANDSGTIKAEYATLAAKETGTILFTVTIVE